MAGLDAVLAAVRPLQAVDHFAGIGGDVRRVFRIGLVGPAPALVARHGQSWREGPVDADQRHFIRRDLADLADQRRVVGRAQADIVREDDGADQVGMAVHGIDAEHQRNMDIGRP